MIVLEPKARYWAKAEAGFDIEGPGIGEASVVRDGDDVTIFAYGSMVVRCLDAAGVLAEDGVSTRVVDLRSLSPLDTGTIARCVRETGRAVVVHEAPRTLGLGAEVAARIVEEAFDFLEAPVRRVTGYDVPYPPAALEQRLPAERGAHRRRRSRGRGVLMTAERVFAMPDLGEGLEEGEIVAWLVDEGDAVELNQPLVEVETAKATVEIPSPFAGSVVALHGSVGSTVPVGAPLVTFSTSAPRPGDGPAAERDTPAAERATPEAGAPARATPPVRKLAKELGVDLAAVAGSGPGGRITADDVRASSGHGEDGSGRRRDPGGRRSEPASRRPCSDRPPSRR